MKRLIQVLFGVAFLGMAMFLALAAYVMTAGIPSPVVRHYVAEFERSQGICIAVDRVRWSPLHHVTANGVRMSLPGGELNAVFRAIEIDIRSDPQRGNNLGNMRCRLSDGRLGFVKSDEHALPSIHLLDCDLVYTADDHTRINLDGSVGDAWQFKVNGVIRHARDKQPASQTPVLGERIVAFSKKLRDLLSIVEEYHAKGLVPDSLTARATFEIDGADIRNSKACVFLDGGLLRFGQATQKPCSAAIQWSNGMLRIDSLKVGSPDSDLMMVGTGTIHPSSKDLSADIRVQASPSYLITAGLLSTNHADSAELTGPLDVSMAVTGKLNDPSSLRLAFRGRSSGNQAGNPGVFLKHIQGTFAHGMLHVENVRLSTEDPMRCLPTRWADALSRAKLNLQGAFNLDASLGPAPVGAILSNITGRVTCDAIKYRDSTLEHAAATFRRKGSRVGMAGATAALIGEGVSHSVSGRGTATTDGVYSFHLETDAPPLQLSSFVPSNVAPLVASFIVNGSSHTEMDISQGTPGTTNVIVRGVIHAADVTRNSVPFDLVHTAIAYSNGTVRLDDLAMVRRDGQVTGNFRYDISDALLSMNGRSTAPPEALIPFIGSGLERLLAPYRLEGPAAIDCEGIIGFKGNPTRDLRLHVEGKQLEWRWVLADQPVFDLTLNEEATVVQDITANWCGGSVSGSFRFERPVHTNLTGRCSMEFLAKDADLATVIAGFHDIEDRKAYQGTLSGDVTLFGSTGKGFLDSAIGDGRINIQDGYILSIPIFGGLSKYLSALIPGLGFASQRDLRGTFTIGEGRIETKDTQLLGNILTIQAKGSYAFNKDVHARVQVLFLKEGLTAAVTRLLTSPLTKALEFELTGTSKEPHWRPANTPDRLLKFFAEKLGALVPHKSKSLPSGSTPRDEW